MFVARHRGQAAGRVEGVGGSRLHLLDQGDELVMPDLGVLRVVEFLSVVTADIGRNWGGGIDDHLVNDPWR